MRSRKKAILILDIDNTILHSIELFKIPMEVMEDINDYMIIPEIDQKLEMLYCKFEKTIAKIRPFF